jgi:2-keto-4-pentenoate hydratase
MSDYSGGPPALADGEHRRLARLLRAAARERRPVEPLSSSYPQLNVADARRIRDSALADRLAEGEELAGAVASPGRAGEPRIAWITDAMVLCDGKVALGDLINPHVIFAAALARRRGGLPAGTLLVAPAG